jgi:hypothetical protein
MKIYYKTLLILFCVLAVIIAQKGQNEAKAVAKKGGIQVFRSKDTRSFEKPFTTLSVGDTVTVLTEESRKLKISINDHWVGWVDRTDMVIISAKQNLFQMDKVQVIGYLDNPQAVYILDASDPNYTPIKVDKSYAKDEYYFQNIEKYFFELENKWIYIKK